MARFVRFSGDPRRCSHGLDLDGRLAKAHLVQDGAWVDDLRGREDAATRSSADAVDGAEKALVEPPIVADPVMNAAAVLQEIRKLVREVSSDEGLVRAVVLLGAVDAGARPVPDLAVAVPRTHEEGRLAVLCVEDQDALRLVEPRQVEEVRVLPVLVLDVVVPHEDRGRGKNGHGRRRGGGHRVEKRGAAVGPGFAIVRGHRLAV